MKLIIFFISCLLSISATADMNSSVKGDVFSTDASSCSGKISGFKIHTDYIEIYTVKNPLSLTGEVITDKYCSLKFSNDDKATGLALLSLVNKLGNGLSVEGMGSLITSVSGKVAPKD